MSKADGDLVHPTTVEHGFNSGEPGMSLRDHFAGLAMQGLVSQSRETAYNSNLGLGATWAYRMADAMIEARKSP